MSQVTITPQGNYALAKSIFDRCLSWYGETDTRTITAKAKVNEAETVLLSWAREKCRSSKDADKIDALFDRAVADEDLKKNLIASSLKIK